jgi:undecaprenyl-diphosphatase
VISRLFDRILDLPPWLALGLVFLLPALEASAFVGLVFPGEVAVILGGVLASQGRLALWLVIVVGALGAIIGDSIGYEVGRRYGSRLLATFPRWLVKPEHIEQAQDLLRRKGGRAVFIGRFTAALRALVPGLAGTSRLPYRRFLAFNVLGGILWVTAIALTGYLAGSSFRAAEHRFSLFSVGILAVVVAAVAYHFLRQSDRVRRWTHTHLGFLFRLDRPIVLSLSVLVASGWLFAGVVQDVMAGDGVALADPKVSADILARRTPPLNVVARATTELGSAVVYPLLLAAGVLLWRRRRDWRTPVMALMVLGTGQLVRLGVMEVVRRPRPPQQFWLAQPDGFAFPSGHTTTATIAYLLIARLLAQLWPVKRTLLFVGAGVLAAAVGVSRVYLGVHWPSDALGGWSLGTAWLALVALAVQARRFREAGNTEKSAADV